MREIPRHADEPLGRLLVVDDDLVQRTVIGKIGAKIGYDVVTASSFEEASGLLRTRRFDAMTLDLSLGERDGVELLRQVAEQKLQAMPIVIISGCDERIMNSTRRVAEGLDLSVGTPLSKPLDLDRLREALSMPFARRPAAGDVETPPAITRDRILAGLEADEFFVEFQPKVRLDDGRVVGAEALARWRTAEFGMVSPADFAPAAERLGLMPALTDRILRRALQQGRQLVERHPDFAIAVNLSASLMSDLDIPDRIESALREAGVPARSLVVEITENLAMEDVQRAMDVLVRLRIKNIGAAIDDFGTGYSSLAALARLPFSELKIDQSFVKGCPDADMMKIVEASVQLARSFGMKVVAEGIDSQQSLARMVRAGCDIGQGYLFAPSLHIDRARPWIAQRNELTIRRPAGRHEPARRQA